MATTRPPTAEETRTAERFVSGVLGNRSTVKRCLDAGAAARDCQAWINSQGLAGVLPSTWRGAPDEDAHATIARRATVLERYAADLQMGGRIYVQNNSAIAGDLNLVIPAPYPEGGPPVYSLGVIPILVIVVGAIVVLIAAAITTSLGFYANVRAKEEETKKRIADLDLAAAKAGGSTAANWKAFKDANAEANGGILGALGKNLGSIAVFGGLIALAIILSKSLPERKAAA